MWGFSVFNPVIGSPEFEEEQLMIKSFIFDAILFIYKVLVSVSVSRIKQAIIPLPAIPSLFQSTLNSIAF